jgi:hypothetical protein
VVNEKTVKTKLPKDMTTGAARHSDKNRERSSSLRHLTFSVKKSEFPLLNGLFNGIVDKLGIPFIAEGLFFPDYGFQNRFKIILASLAKLPVADVEIIPVGYRIFHCMSAYVTGKGLHNKLLNWSIKPVPNFDVLEPLTLLYSKTKKMSRYENKISG